MRWAQLLWCMPILKMLGVDGCLNYNRLVTPPQDQENRTDGYNAVAAVCGPPLLLLVRVVSHWLCWWRPRLDL
jgi:hypothetical protein